MNILVVDDEHDIELLFKQKFRREIRNGELRFDFAHSAEEAIEQLQSDELSSLVVLILSDINMPGMSGLELLKIVKTKLPHLKVYMITAYGDSQTFSTAQHYGADGYLNKPLDFKLLRDQINRLTPPVLNE